MFTEVHTDFILNPLMAVLADGVLACTSLPMGIGNSALGEYFMQSLFLRMTGAQEQKMKCICWVMATNDYRYRYDLLNSKQYGECSEYKHKKGIFEDLYNQIRGYNIFFSPSDILEDVFITKERTTEMRNKWTREIDSKRKIDADKIIAEQMKKRGVLDQAEKDKFLNDFLNKDYPETEWKERLFMEKKNLFIRDIIRDLLTTVEQSPLTAWNYREYLFFKDHWQDVLNEKQLILSNKEFLGSSLQEFYRQLVYVFRNRTAHNTASYMKDVPTLDTLADKDYVYKNYFFRFAILLLIDEVFMRLFRRYRELGMNTI